MHRRTKNKGTFEQQKINAMKRLTTILFFCIILQSTWASLFKSYQVEDGLSHNCVWAVMQDKEGFLWFGTVDGLNKFDGITFKTYKKQQDNPLSIGNNFVHCLKEDSKGRFFVGTKQGLYLFNRISETFTHISLNNSSSKEDDTSINYIMEDTEGNIWLGCYGQGIFVLSPNLKIIKHYTSKNNNKDLLSNYIWCMAQDYNGIIWIGTDGAGLLKLDPKENKVTSIKDYKQFNITDQTIYSLYCDIDNNIWIGTSISGLYRCNFRTGRITNITAPYRKVLNIKAITKYDNNTLVMGSDAGLLKVDRSQETVYFMNEGSSFDNITDKSIFSIARDKEGGLWIGTYFGGINYYSSYINNFSYYPNIKKGIGKSIVSYFVEGTSDKIWVGTKNEGLSLFNPSASSFDVTPKFTGYHDIQALMIDNNNLWVSIYGKGVNVINTQNNKLVKTYTNKTDDPNHLISNIVNTIFKTSKGTILFGTPEGVNYIEPNSSKVNKFTRLNNIPIKAILEDYNGSLWFAAHMHGLIHLTAHNKWEFYTHHQGDITSLMSNNVNCIYQDSHYRMWVGTEGEGLGLFNIKTKKIEYKFNEKARLPSNIIYSILEDTEGNIWVSTGSGLARINPITFKIQTFKYIEDLIKLRYNLNCAFKGKNNHLYFGGTNGFISFNPKEIKSNLHRPSICITGFQISGKEVIPSKNGSPLKTDINSTQTITLRYNQSTFSFDFVCLSYLSSIQNRFAYKLEGFDSDWNYTTAVNHKATYMNIPPGKYTFCLKGSNNNGIWCNTPARIMIIVKRPFLLSSPMIALYCICIITLLYWIIRKYNRRLERNNQEKIYKYKAAKEKEIYETKINFFTSMAHEIRTPLSLIVAPLENIIASGDGNLQTKDNLEIIKRNSNRLLKLVNQLLDFRKIEEDMFQLSFRKQNISELIRNICERYSQYTRLKNLTLKVHIPNESIICCVDSEAIEKIINNLLSNATKYAKSEIILQIRTDNNILYISIDDDGIEIPEKYIDKIFEPFFQIGNNAQKTGTGIGLSLSKSLANKHKGNITVSSEPGKNTRFTLELPLDIPEDIITTNATDNKEEKLIVQSTSSIPDDKLKVILVEDNMELRNFLSKYLCDYLDVYEAQNGLEALKLIETENVDIIISDILMPIMDGLELCKTVKSNPAYSHLPFILLSAKTDTATKVEGLNSGADIYMEKPFSCEQLQAQINSIINNRDRIRKNFIQSPLEYYKQKDTENSVNADFIKQLNNIILENLTNENFSIDNLSDMFLMSRSNLHKKIKNIIGLTPNDYIKLIRLNKSAQLLATGKYKVNEVCYLVGFNTPSYFSKCFYDHFGKLPKDSF